MNLLYAVFILLFGISNGALLGAKECTYGPAYWCSSLKTATECNAMNHCIQAVWEKQILPEDNDDICMICKDMVKEARDQLLSNETQDEIRQVFEGSCKLIPVALIRDECIKVSDDFIPQLIDTLASQMNPQIVCATAGLCNSPKVDQLLIEYYETNPKKEIATKIESPRDCNDCKNFIHDIVKEVKSLPESEVFNRVLTICQRLGSLSDGCMSLVQTNFNFIYSFLTTKLNENEFCEVFGMCSRMYGKTTVTIPRTEDEPCDFCVAIVNNWRNNLLSNTTKEQFKMILDGMCEHTGNFKSECLSLVDQYFELVYEIITSEINAKELCEAVGLCGANALFKNDLPLWTTFEMKPEDHLNLVPLKPSIDNIVGKDEAASYKNDIHLPRVSLTSSKIEVVNLANTGILKDGSKAVTKSQECVMCEFALHFLQNTLNNPATRDEIKTEVEKVCNWFPKSVSEQCVDYIDAYGDQLIQMLELELDPSQVCPMIHMCPSVNALKSKASDGTTCLLCEYVMTELDTILEDKHNEAEIKDALESVCSVIPKSVRPQCLYFIDMYFEQILDLLLHDFTPKQICTQIGLCPDNVEEKPVESKFKAKQSTSCILCEFMMQEIDSVLVSNATEIEIRDVIDKVCLWLPHSLTNDCLGFVEQYSDSIVELLVKDLDPETVCREIKLCKSNLFMKGMIKAQLKNPSICWMCEAVVDWFDQQIAADAIINLVTRALDEVCSLFPDKTKIKCIDFVNKYGPLISKLIEELTNSKRVCQALKMCPFHGSQPLLGAKKCTWGPGYWCQSQLHAQSCKAMDHCTEKVWLGSAPNY